MFTKKRRMKREHSPEEVVLQITSLADILVVVLVFMLKSLASSWESMENVKVPHELNLPTAQVGGKTDEGIQIEITKDAVQIDGKEILKLSEYKFAAGEVSTEYHYKTSKALSSAISVEKQNLGDTKKRIWILADHKVPYATIQTVMASAAVSGYSDFSLAVVQGE